MSADTVILKVAISTIGKFSSFYIARQLLKRDMLAGVYTAYPRFALEGEGIPKELLHCFPWLQMPYMARRKLKLTNKKLEREWAWYAHTTLDSWTARHLPDCDVFIGLSGGGLFTGRVAKKRGMGYVCHRGSADIRYQSEILREEYARFNSNYDPVDPRKVAREVEEYALADAITAPSQFACRTFVECGVPAEKVHCVNYGVPLERFSKTGDPDPDTFDVIFVGGASIRKGVPYLLDAFEMLEHPRKRLRFAGTLTPEISTMIEAKRAKGLTIETLGHIPGGQLKDTISVHHALVLPSIEDGFPHVVVQAMACGCPPIVSDNVGAADVMTDGENGYVVPIRDAESVANRLQGLANDPALQKRMGAAALERVHSIGGWDTFGDAYVKVLEPIARRR